MAPSWSPFGKEGTELVTMFSAPLGHFVGDVLRDLLCLTDVIGFGGGGVSPTSLP